MEKKLPETPFSGIYSNLSAAMIACVKLSLSKDMQTFGFQAGLLAISADISKMNDAVRRAEVEYLRTLKSLVNEDTNKSNTKN